jgi:hypothetical protein
VTGNSQERKNRIGKISKRRRKEKGNKKGEKEKVQLDPIEEKMDDHHEEKNEELEQSEDRS